MLAHESPALVPFSETPVCPFLSVPLIHQLQGLSGSTCVCVCVCVGISRQVCVGCGSSTVSRQGAFWEMRWVWAKPSRSSASWLHSATARFGHVAPTTSEHTHTHTHTHTQTHTHTHTHTHTKTFLFRKA